MPSLSDRVELIRSSPIRKIASLLDKSRSKESIISFGGGAPSLPPPPEVIEEMKRLLREKIVKAVGYCGTKGLPELRRLIAMDIEESFGTHYDPEEIIITEGATEGILLSLFAVLNKNDEVIIVDPTYVGFSEPIKLAGGRVKTIPAFVNDGYQPKVDDLESCITTRTKAFILLSPDNPTGRIISAGFAKALVDLAVDRDFWIIYDATYKHIVYEGENVWIPKFSGAMERTIVVNTFSKEASIPGLRLGYTLAPKEVIEAMEKIKQYTSLAPSTLGQYALLKYYEDDIKGRYLKEVVLPTYRRRRDLMGELIRKHLPEAKTVMPQGAFYYFVDMSSYLEKMGRDDKEFANRLFYRKEVVVIPGSFFGKRGVGHVRLTFVSEPEERIREGIERMGEFVFSYAI